MFLFRRGIGAPQDCNFLHNSDISNLPEPGKIHQTFIRTAEAVWPIAGIFTVSRRN
jgi:hypothetical protein